MSNTFPIKCLECASLVGHKYDDFLNKIRGLTDKDPKSYLYDMFLSNSDNNVGAILDELEIAKPCCRTMFVTNLEIGEVDHYIKIT